MSEEILIRQGAPTLAGIKTGSLFPLFFDAVAFAAAVDVYRAGAVDVQYRARQRVGIVAGKVAGRRRQGTLDQLDAHLRNALAVDRQRLPAGRKNFAVREKKLAKASGVCYGIAVNRWCGFSKEHWLERLNQRNVKKVGIDVFLFYHTVRAV
mgnify:CR=1 FL=1